MEKYAWTAKIKKGCLEEYIRRHERIWQEMRDTLREE
jgi:L-rhamnose mutarotase